MLNILNKYTYSKVSNHIGLFGKFSSVLIIFSFIFTANLHANFAGTSTRPFALEYTTNIKGNVKIIGNTIIGQNSGANTACPGVNANNAQVYTKYWDIDGDASTFSSSSSNLVMPAGAVVKKAYLFWQGLADANQDITVRRIKLKTPTSGGYITLNAAAADMNWQYNNNNAGRANSIKYPYQGMIDVTNYVSASGTYTVADLTTYTATNLYYDGLGTFGAWALLVVYESDAEELNNIVVYRGYIPIAAATVGITSYQTFNISGFLTPTSGSVQSKFLVFAGEGDVDISGDLIQIDGVTLTRNGANGNNAFSAAITENGVAVTTKSPNCANNLGIDIHTYNVGTSGQKIIKNSQTSATIRLGTSQDTYFPSVFAFSTQLYQPRVCYYIDTITDKNSNATVFENGAFTGSVDKNKEYKFDIWISNMAQNASDPNLETAKLVEIGMQFANTSTFSYVPNLTYMANIGIPKNSKVHLTDAVDSDLGEYNSAQNMSIWRIGTTASGTVGGTLQPTTNFNDDSKKVFVEFTGKIGGTADKNIDLISLLNFKASFKTDSIAIDKNNALPIPQCRNFSTNTSVNNGIGVYNVVNESFSGSSTHTSSHNADNALYTQITDLPFNAKLLSINPESTGDVRPLVGVSGNQSFEVHIIPTPNFTGCGANKECKQNLCDSAPTNATTRVFAGNFGAYGGDKIIPLNNLNATKALREASFKIIVQDAEHQSCSVDSFTVRPATFDLSGEFGGALVGGNITLGKISAVNLAGNTKDSYNQTANKIERENATLDLPSGCTDLNANISESHFNITNSNFAGGISNFSVKYLNVGKVLATFTDKDWAAADENNNDCIKNGSNARVNGKVGCYVTANKTLKFVPSKFDSDLRIANFNDGSFTYTSNAKQMSANIYLTFKAMLYDGITIATNYHKNCFARNTTYTLDLIETPQGWTNVTEPTAADQVRFHSFNGTNTIIVSPTNATAEGDEFGGNHVTYGSSDNIFDKGVASSMIRFGFSREKNIAQDPFIVKNIDFNITLVKDTDDVKGSDFQRLVISNTTFYYGRVKSLESLYVGESPIVAQVNYEVYCGVGCPAAAYGINTSKKHKGENWYINVLHNAVGYGKVTAFTSIGLAQPNPSQTDNIAVGIETNSVSNGAAYTPYADTIQMRPDSWLVYNKHNKNAIFEKFDVEFFGNGGGWAGEGTVKHDDNGGAVDIDVGRASETNASKHSRRTIEW